LIGHLDMLSWCHDFKCQPPPDSNWHVLVRLRRRHRYWLLLCERARQDRRSSAPRGPVRGLSAKAAS
jgi:hypothetical protein